jgi:hypothetical protein
MRVRVWFHGACCEWRGEQEATARGAGAHGLNLSEAKGRDLCAAPALPVWPGPHPPPLVAHLYAPHALPPRMIAAGKLIEHEANPKPPDKD